jgi:hypothetical protein
VLQPVTTAFWFVEHVIENGHDPIGSTWPILLKKSVLAAAML